jgi:hypothetical protein
VSLGRNDDDFWLAVPVKLTLTQNNGASPPTISMTLHNWGGSNCPDVTGSGEYTNQATGQFTVSWTILSTYGPECNPNAATFTMAGTAGQNNGCAEFTSVITETDNNQVHQAETWDTCDGMGRLAVRTAGRRTTNVWYQTVHRLPGKRRPFPVGVLCSPARRSTPLRSTLRLVNPRYTAT